MAKKGRGDLGLILTFGPSWECGCWCGGRIYGEPFDLSISMGRGRADSLSVVAEGRGCQIAGSHSLGRCMISELADPIPSQITSFERLDRARMNTPLGRWVSATSEAEHVSEGTERPFVRRALLGQEAEGQEP